MEEVVLVLVLDKKEDACDWVYRNEGAANLVLSYTGSSLPSLVGKVMRLPKAPKNGIAVIGSPTFHARVTGSVLTKHEKLVWKDYNQLLSSPNREILEQLYAQLVISPLLGHQYVDAGMRVRVSKEFLQAVENNITSQRPAWRVDAAEVDVHRDSVIILSDHSLFGPSNVKEEPCISVEIKPKCGFVPDSIYIAERNSIKRSISRFEMHQALKLDTHLISEKSKYNPLNLFSGSKDKIHEAIEALYSTPQNNFRVFSNGSLIFGGLGGGIKGTNVVVEKAFEDALKFAIHADDGQRTKIFLELISEAVYNSKVLNRLLEAQKLDKFDIEGVIHSYYNVISEPCMACREIDEKDRQRYAPLHSKSLDENLEIVKNFLIAATAKDTSLMISFRPRKQGESVSSYNNVYLKSTGQIFEYKMHFIDLDLKPMKKIEDYYEMDKKIVCYYNDAKKKEDSMKPLASRLTKCDII
ncbi:hypothetical protein ACFE04_012079 [Oxalis oulophora]